MSSTLKSPYTRVSQTGSSGHYRSFWGHEQQRVTGGAMRSSYTKYSRVDDEEQK